MVSAVNVWRRCKYGTSGHWGNLSHELGVVGIDKMVQTLQRRTFFVLQVDEWGDREFLGAERCSESEDSRALEEHVVCSRNQEDGRSVRDQDQTLQKCWTFRTLQWEADGLVPRADMRNEERRTSLLGLFVSHFPLGMWKCVHHKHLRKVLARAKRCIWFSLLFQRRASTTS